MKVTEIGNVILSPKIILYKVLLIPSFKYNLISISSLTSHLKCVVLCFDIACLLQAPSLKRPLKIGNVHDGLYLLLSGCLKKTNNISASENYFSNLVFPSKCNLVDKMYCSYYFCSHSCHSPIINNMPFINKGSVSFLFMWCFISQ